MTDAADPAEFPYAYHVSFQAQPLPGDRTHMVIGSTVLYRRTPIGTPTDLDWVKRDLTKSVIEGDWPSATASVVILSWQPFPGWGRGGET